MIKKNTIYRIMTINDFKDIKSETRKYQIMARHLESLAINSDIESIKEIEKKELYKPYIKYIGGIGNSRALQFCVSKICNENEAIKTINYIVEYMKQNKKRITLNTITGMLNVAIIHEKEKVIDHILEKKEFKSKIKFSDNEYMIIKNMTDPNQKEDRRILKRLIIEKVIPLDEKTRNMIKRSKDETIEEIVRKIDFKEDLEKRLEKRVNNKTKKLKI